MAEGIGYLKFAMLHVTLAQYILNKKVHAHTFSLIANFSYNVGFTVIWFGRLVTFKHF